MGEDEFSSIVEAVLRMGELLLDRPFFIDTCSSRSRNLLVASVPSAASSMRPSSCASSFFTAHLGVSHRFKLTVAYPSGGTFLAHVDHFPKPHDSSAVLELAAVFGVQGSSSTGTKDF
ncbi:hypothetical protein [Herbiconiux sp. L3-i23]|uniref:hypothetical protein n=1 Tax=Herbiconiux sp. L3-i23 TaxID=2905871 RepID=UPI002073AB3A|nr:hypothetical protein [Herbiconiux sp. L3-i23]